MTNTPPQLPTPKQHTDLYNILYKASVVSSGVRCVNEDEWPIQQLVEWHNKQLQAQRKELERENLQLRFLLSEIIDGLDRDVSVEKDIRDAKKFLGELEERKLLESLPTTRGEGE